MKMVIVYTTNSSRYYLIIMNSKLNHLKKIHLILFEKDKKIKKFKLQEGEYIVGSDKSESQICINNK